MMCCCAIEWDKIKQPNGDWKKQEPNGKCPDCGEDTVDGVAYHQCCYSPVECKTCNWRPCDGSC